MNPSAPVTKAILFMRLRCPDKYEDPLLLDRRSIVCEQTLSLSAMSKSSTKTLIARVADAVFSFAMSTCANAIKALNGEPKRDSIGCWRCTLATASNVVTKV